MYGGGVHYHLFLKTSMYLTDFLLYEIFSTVQKSSATLNYCKFLVITNLIVDKWMFRITKHPLIIN